MLSQRILRRRRKNSVYGNFESKPFEMFNGLTFLNKEENSFDDFLGAGGNFGSE